MYANMPLKKKPQKQYGIEHKSCNYTCNIFKGYAMIYVWLPPHFCLCTVIAVAKRK